VGAFTQILKLVSTICPTPLSHNVTNKVDNHNDRQHVVALRRTTVLGCVLQEFDGTYVDSKLRGTEASCITSGWHTQACTVSNKNLGSGLQTILVILHIQYVFAKHSRTESSLKAHPEDAHYRMFEHYLCK